MLFYEEQAALFCMHCQKETPHHIHYLDQQIASIDCQICQNQISIDLDAMKIFHQYLYERLISKPGRLTEEARQDFSHFLTSLPMRIVSKPVRFSQEYAQMNKEVRDYLDREVPHD
ncbi:hypothetical protein RU97_GL001589 [Enterococcus canis]|uniref:Bh protein n=1 Tax=Enterococcus canis TaxID=214095 RepID=A0A1L8RGP7_9ENTE|nr:hypothetical protein [Enterococcus canis]OJG18971.1 hypothetical protein RU97_GL001589 [Enterococcus canis]